MYRGHIGSHRVIWGCIDLYRVAWGVFQILRIMNMFRCQGASGYMLEVFVFRVSVWGPGKIIIT